MSTEMTASQILDRIRQKQLRQQAAIPVPPVEAAAEEEDCCDYCRDQRLELEETEAEIQADIRRASYTVEWSMLHAQGLASQYGLEESPEALLKITGLILQANIQRSV